MLKKGKSWRDVLTPQQYGAMMLRYCKILPLLADHSLTKEQLELKKKLVQKKK